MSSPSPASVAAPAPAGASRVNAYDRLMGLPAVFALSAFVRMTGLNRLSAKVMLSRWIDRGLIEPAGPRAGVYFNRLRDPEGKQASVVQALLMKYPSATLTGASVLHAHGWTTQIPRSLHVAVESRRSYTQIEGITLHPRPRRWFRQMHLAGALMPAHGSQASHADHGDGAEAAGPSQPQATTYGLRSLRPAWALADSFASWADRSWRPDEDDLDLPAEDAAEIGLALFSARADIDADEHPDLAVMMERARAESAGAGEIGPATESESARSKVTRQRGG